MSFYFRVFTFTLTVEDRGRINKCGSPVRKHLWGLPTGSQWKANGRFCLILSYNFMASFAYSSAFFHPVRSEMFSLFLLIGNFDEMIFLAHICWGSQIMAAPVRPNLRTKHSLTRPRRQIVTRERFFCSGARSRNDYWRWRRRRCWWFCWHGCIQRRFCVTAPLNEAKAFLVSTRDSSHLSGCHTFWQLQDIRDDHTE